MIPVITIEGATASGKTKLALELAERFETEIISADSRQVYRYLNIGTSKPGSDQLNQVKHHFIDVINPDESYNAGLFRKDAAEIIKKLINNRKIPIICGGTGLYVKALLEGLFRVDIHDQKVRNELEHDFFEKGLGYLYQELLKIDHNSAEKISGNDKQRILRALEVYKVTGIPISEHWKKQDRKSHYYPYRILLDEERQTLYTRIDTRILAMINAGLIEEIKDILLRGFKWSDPGFNSVGYKEFKPFFDHDSPIEKCIEVAQQHTRNYAKRQYTWYRKCTFNLAGTLSSINFNYIEKNMRIYFEKIDPEDNDGKSC
jgi:tRNA dimethylallyltransferase